MSKSKVVFKRQLFGYRRKAVDEHLAVVDASIADLREAVGRATEPEHHDLVLRATRLAVEEIMQRAHDEARRIRTEAETEAARVLVDAYDIAAIRDEVIDLRPEFDDAEHTEPAPDPEASDAVAERADEDETTGLLVDRDWNADLARVIDD